MVPESTGLRPRYPIYIISKGRWESRLTSKALEAMQVPYRIVIELQEYEQYSSVISQEKILVLPFSNLGQGSIPARNWVWEHSISEGHERHWILDDNIRCFWTVKNARRCHMENANVFILPEMFVDRYSNVAIMGLNYEGLCAGITDPLKRNHIPFSLNTRIYSCLSIDNSIPFRWRGRYNEDTDLSLRVLKAGYCTILFNAFLAEKRTTLKMKGGNTDELYKQTADFDGRYEMAKSLYMQHPDVTKITRKWGRWQHHVDYRPFRCNKLIRKNGTPDEVHADLSPAHP